MQIQLGSALGQAYGRPALQHMCQAISHCSLPPAIMQLVLCSPLRGLYFVHRGKSVYEQADKAWESATARAAVLSRVAMQGTTEKPARALWQRESQLRGFPGPEPAGF